MSNYAAEAELGEFGELEGEGEYGEYGEFEGELGERGEQGRAVSPLTDAQEVELASELLEINNEAELEQFLGNLISKIGGFFRSPVGQALGGIVKNVAKQALPTVGGALSSMVGLGSGPGTQLGSYASGLFELELESMPQEQAEFEVARRVVGLTAAAANKAAQTPPRPDANPYALARAAVIEAAKNYAPGYYRQMLERSRTGEGRISDGRAGYWAPDVRMRAAGYPVAPGPAYRSSAAPPYRAPAAPGYRAPTAPGYRGPAAPGYRGPAAPGSPGYRFQPGYWFTRVPGRRPRGYGAGLRDFPLDGLDDGWGFDVDTLATDGFGTARPMTGRWVRRGRRIILLGI